MSESEEQSDILISINEVKELTDAETLTNPFEFHFNNILTDTREDLEDSLFVAFKGENFDGHQFLQKAILLGAKGIICSEKPYKKTIQLAKQEKCTILLVKDTLIAYQRLAILRRFKNKECKIIAITGSTGKTSVKTILAHLLENEFPGQVLSTIANTNNQIGVAKNLLRLKSTDKFAVLELGSSEKGEIARIAAIANPDISVITGIGLSHIAQFGSLAEVAKEKSAIIEYMKNEGKAVIEESCLELIKNTKVLNTQKYVTFGAEKIADYAICELKNDINSSLFKIHQKDKLSYEIKSGLTGKHQAINTAACFAVVDLLGLDMALATQAMSSVQLPGMRMKMIEHKESFLINDAYNANPQSTKALFDWLHDIIEKKEFTVLKIVLGDLLELGENSADLHKEIAESAKKTFPNAEILTVGELMKNAFGKDASQSFEKSAEAANYLQNNLKPGDLTVLKGSRGMKLELIEEICFTG